MYQQEIQLGENRMGEKLRSFSPIFDEILKLTGMKNSLFHPAGKCPQNKKEK